MKRQMDAGERGSEKRRRAPIAVCIVVAALACGCASDNGKQPATRPTSMRERQDAALRDPFSYKPGLGTEDQDISGGDIGHYDKRGMKRDIDHVLNP